MLKGLDCHPGLPVLVVESLLGISTTHSEIVETALVGWLTKQETNSEMAV